MSAPFSATPASDPREPSEGLESRTRNEGEATWRTIPATYRAHGWNYKLIERNETAAIYAQSMHPDLPAGGKATVYEVVLIRICPPRHTGKFQFEGGEILPHDAEWGIYGWTCHSLERAREKLAEVTTPDRIAAAIAARERILGTPAEGVNNGNGLYPNFSHGIPPREVKPKE